MGWYPVDFFKPDAQVMLAHEAGLEDLNQRGVRDIHEIQSLTSSKNKMKN